MASAINKLSAAFVNSCKVPGHYGDGLGLWLQVSDYETKSWVKRYTMHGRSREMGLGSANVYGLAEARERNDEAETN